MELCKAGSSPHGWGPPYVVGSLWGGRLRFRGIDFEGEAFSVNSVNDNKVNRC